ncbi:MAG TPA: hypothetical protein VF744_05175 [Beijerinckiaceae bacterium]
MQRVLPDETRPAPHRAPRYLALGSCLLIAILAAIAGASLRLAKPVDPPDPAFLERLAAWKALAPEAARMHHLQGPARAP